MPRKYEVWVCPDCGEQITIHEFKRGHYHDPPEGWWTEDGGCGPENKHGEDPWFDAVLITAIDERDVSPLVEALEEAIVLVGDWASYASDYFQEKHDLEGDLNRLRAALKPFEAEEGSG